LNYGVIFSPVRTVKLVSGTWSHIFDLHLPDLTLGNLHLQLPYCNNATEQNRALVVKLHRQHVDMVDQILQTLQPIYHLLPTEQNISRPLSRKRSLLPIGGVLLSQLFGTTSEADLQPM